jgi:signal transduction histidine kinase
VITNPDDWRTFVTMTSVDGARKARSQQRQDLALAGLLFIATEIVLWAGTESKLPLGLRMLLAGIATLALVGRRRAPLPVLAVSGAATLALLAGHGTIGPAVFAPLIALYTVALTTERRLSIAAAIVSLVGVLLAVAVESPNRSSWTKFLFPIVVVGACWLIGDNLRVRRAYVAELEEKAARAESDRAADLSRAASDERARIARELHDVVVHHVSVIAVQAGAARMLSDQDGMETSSPAWAAVEETARQALSELRQLLGVLRRDQERPALEPQPGLAQLDRLIQEVRQAGLPVELLVSGDRVPLSPAADLSTYRIVQEALTNVLKHQGTANTRVSLCYGLDELNLEVVNEASSGARSPQLSKGEGHGLIGMRERLTMLGGSLDARPCPDGGFRVAARIPLKVMG